jgi:YfiR/HmsC-like
MKSVAVRSGIAFILVLALSGCVTRQPTAEYRDKATYLFRFGQFIEWPGYLFPDAKTPVTIGFLGGNPFGDVLETMARTETINGHPVVVRRMTPLSNLRKCHILFIAHSQKVHLPLIFESLKGSHVLTVSDADGFLEAGGMIHFFMENGKVRFEIDRQATDRAGLKIESQLSIMAKHPKGGPDEK